MKTKKRFLSILLSLAVVLGLLPGMCARAQITLCGDVNCDGQVDMMDVLILNRYLDDASVYCPTDQGKINADCCDYKSGAGLDENDSLAIQRYLTYGIRHLPCTAADLKGSMNKSVSDYRQPYGGNPGGDTADVTFSFEDTSGQNTVTVAPGAKIMVSVNIDAGENPIAAIDAQFKCSDEINVSAISDTSGIIKGGVQSNIGALFANMVNPKGLSSEVDKGKAAFQLTVTIPADAREGSYTVGFSEHCRVYKDWTTSSIYSTSFTPLTIKVAEKKPATTKPKPATEKKPATTESTPATTTEKKKETEPGNANRILNLKGSQTGLKLTLKWNRKSGASMCKIYGGYCGPKMKLLKTIKGNNTTKATFTKLNGKELDLKKEFKFRVIAYKTADGKNKQIAKSLIVHIAGNKNTNYTNAKAVKVTKKNYSLETGKKAKIKPRLILANKKKKALPVTHGPRFRYVSSNKAVASVNKSGEITAKKAGTCTIYVYAINGCANKIKVIVK